MNKPFPKSIIMIGLPYGVTVQIKTLLEKDRVREIFDSARSRPDAEVVIPSCHVTEVMENPQSRVHVYSVSEEEFHVMYEPILFWSVGMVSPPAMVDVVRQHIFPPGSQM